MVSHPPKPPLIVIDKFWSTLVILIFLAANRFFIDEKTVFAMYRSSKEKKQSKTPHSPSKKGIHHDAYSTKLKKALGLHRQGQLDKAEVLYRQILKLKPHHFDALQLLAAIVLQRDEYREALKLFGRAFKINAQHPSLLNNYGLALMGLQRYREALEHYDKALALNPAYPEAIANRSLALQELKRLEVSKTVPVPPSAPKVLLVAFQWTTLIELPYMIKQAGCHVDLLCPKENYWLRVNSFYDNWINAGATLDSLIAVLLQLHKGKSYQYIIIGDDPILWKIYREKIRDLWDVLPFRNKSVVSIMSKIGFSEYCRDYLIKSPEFKPVDAMCTASDALHSLGLPIVVKVNYSAGGEGVRIFQDEPSYYGFMEAYDFKEPLLVQRFIPGEQVCVEALFNNGKLLQYVCAMVIDRTTGPGTKRRYFPNEAAIGDLITLLGQGALMHGFVNISLIRDSVTEHYFLFEADQRPNKWVPYARWFGCDFARGFKTLMTDRPDIEDELCSTLNAPENTRNIPCWEAEYFPDHAFKLFNSGRTNEAIRHLMDYDRNLRYTLYDPVLLEAKMNHLQQRFLKAINKPQP